MSVFGGNLQGRLFYAKKQHILQPCFYVKNGVHVLQNTPKMTKMANFDLFLTHFRDFLGKSSSHIG